MAEKRNLQKVIKRLALFEVRESERVERILERPDREGFTEGQWAIMERISDRRGREEFGFWGYLYLASAEIDETVPLEEQKGERFDLIRYARYEEVLSDLPAAPSHLETKDYLEREALLIFTTSERERGWSFSDSFNAMTYLKKRGENLRYCAPWKKWMIWDGRRWIIDERLLVYEWARESVDSLATNALDISRNADETVAVVAHSKRSLSSHKLESMMTIARSVQRIGVLPEEMDRNPFLLNCANGVLDLKNGRLSPHDRSHLITKLCPIPYEPEAPCVRWCRFLRDILDGDRDLIKFVQKFLGCCLTGDMSCQCMFILYGTGANGKSTFISIVNKILGDYAKTTPTETFMEKRGDQASNDIAGLKGSRLVTATESDQRGRLAESVIKRLTGNDVISARFLYGEYFSFIPTFKIVMATNHKPNIGGMDYAIWRRIKLIPFEVSFKEAEQDKNLAEKLEKELPGILRWMVEGCLKWQKEGLGNVQAVDEAVGEYRTEMSDVQMFISECCEREEESMIKSSILYGHYTVWCETNNERPKSNRKFSMMLAESGMDKVRTSAGVHWIGLKMKEDS